MNHQTDSRPPLETAPDRGLRFELRKPQDAKPAATAPDGSDEALPFGLDSEPVAR